jgi:hypothetical protein
VLRALVLTPAHRRREVSLKLKPMSDPCDAGCVCLSTDTPSGYKGLPVQGTQLTVAASGGGGPHRRDAGGTCWLRREDCGGGGVDHTAHHTQQRARRARRAVAGELGPERAEAIDEKVVVRSLRLYTPEPSICANRACSGGLNMGRR